MDINRCGVVPIMTVVIVVVVAVAVVVVVNLCGSTFVCKTVVIGTVVGDNKRCGVVPKVTVVVVGKIISPPLTIEITFVTKVSSYGFH